MDISKINSYAVLDIQAPMTTKLNAYAILDALNGVVATKILAYAIIDDGVISPPSSNNKGSMLVFF